MANPLNNASDSAATWTPNFIVEGVSTIVWGTEGEGPQTGGAGGFIYPSGYAGYIVVSASESRRIEEIDIEQGSGFEAVVILLNKGLDVELEVIDDTSVTVPSAGAVVTLSTPFGSANMLLVGDKTNQARKREGMRTFSFKSYTAINLGNPS